MLSWNLFLRILVIPEKSYSICCSAFPFFLDEMHGHELFLANKVIKNISNYYSIIYLFFLFHMVCFSASIYLCYWCNISHDFCYQLAFLLSLPHVQDNLCKSFVQRNQEKWFFFESFIIHIVSSNLHIYKIIFSA